MIIIIYNIRELESAKVSRKVKWTKGGGGREKARRSLIKEKRGGKGRGEIYCVIKMHLILKLCKKNANLS